MKLIPTLLIVIFFALPVRSFADICSIDSTLFRTVSMGNVLVQRDASVGTEIARVKVSDYSVIAGFSSDGVAYCNGGYTFNYLSATPSSMSGVFNTNVQGVGIKTSFDAGGFTLASHGANIRSLWYLGDYNIILYKTGDITPGPLTPGLIGRGWFGSPDNDFMQISMDANSQITVLACSLTSQVINFNLGDINASEFSDQPGFSPAKSDTQNLGLNCDASANINVELMGTPNPDALSAPGVLALNGQGTSGTADGVGVQIIYNTVPLQLNNRIVLKRSTGGLETFPLVARYYQTKPIVKPGSANATATLNITYQ